VTPIIQDYMKKNSISIIIDKKNIFIAQSNYEITDEILELINKNIK
jgi:Skp family chaperone for outer membrane proteins